MSRRVPARPAALPADRSTLRTLAEQAFSRTAGAPLVGGNAVRVLRDATENYPAWEAAIAGARHTIHLEMYIIRCDLTGRRFVRLLAERARAGVEVRVVYDWLGCGLGPALGLFKPLVAAGGRVRTFNPPSIMSALGWVRRNHRKLVIVDGRVAFVSGLCIGDVWTGRPDRGLDPWRDTGLEMTGPIVAKAEEAFAESWRLAGGPADRVAPPAIPEPTGEVDVRLIPTEPFTANMLRLDLFVATLARQSLWIADAYFIGTGPYLEALKRAATDGVDVRLLLPQGSDVGWTVPVSRSLYRPLLEAGVRIFEWQGTMMHAKTAVADSRWARVGSTNLNLNSWMGNWEMDVALENAGVATTLASHYEDDLSRSMEIVLETRGHGMLRPFERGAAPRTRLRRSSRRVVRTVTGVGRSLGAAISGNRPLEDFELAPLVAAGVLLAVVAIVGVFAPRLLAWPVALFTAWTALTFLAEGWSEWRRRRPKNGP